MGEREEQSRRAGAQTYQGGPWQWMSDIAWKNDMRRSRPGAVDVLEDAVIIMVEDIERLYGAARHDVVMVPRVASPN